jgi:hypothetical protein
MAQAAGLPAMVEGLDDRTDEFMQATDRAEIRINGPFVREPSHHYFHLYVDVNVLLTSRYDETKNRYAILKFAGLFQEAMDTPINVYRYGSEPGDDQTFVGCLTPRRGVHEMVEAFQFGQVDPTDALKQTAVDARYVMYLSP